MKGGSIISSLAQLGVSHSIDVSLPEAYVKVMSFILNRSLREFKFFVTYELLDTTKDGKKIYRMYFKPYKYTLLNKIRIHYTPYLFSKKFARIIRHRCATHSGFGILLIRKGKIPSVIYPREALKYIIKSSRRLEKIFPRYDEESIGKASLKRRIIFKLKN